MNGLDLMLDRVDWHKLDVDVETFGSGALYATHEGVLTIGDISLKVFVLNDGQRLFDAADVEALFGQMPPSNTQEKPTEETR